MPYVELLPVPKRTEQLSAYLQANFRRIADALAMTASLLGGKDIEITDSTMGVILTAPNLNRYRITVGNTGTLTTTLVP